MGKLRVVLRFALLSALIIIAVPMLGAEAQETLLWEADVPAHCSPLVSSPVLEAGREYRIVAQGAFASYELTGLYNFVADAQYYTPVSWLAHYYVWDPGNTFPAPGGHSFLQINGMDVNWGPFSNGYPDFTGHEYSITYIGMGAPITFQIVDWIDDDCTHNYCTIYVKIYELPAPPEAETAYAYGGDYATCFLSMGFRNWGWSNGPLGHGNYTFDIYAGAARCNINKGTLVGALIISYSGSTAWIAYSMDAGWAMERTHLYVDGEPLPRDNGEYTTSPGQYPYIHDPVLDPTWDTYTVSGLSGDIYVVAHADVFEV